MPDSQSGLLPLPEKRCYFSRIELQSDWNHRLVCKWASLFDKWPHLERLRNWVRWLEVKCMSSKRKSSVGGERRKKGGGWVIERRTRGKMHCRHMFQTLPRLVSQTEFERRILHQQQKTNPLPLSTPLLQWLRHFWQFCLNSTVRVVSFKLPPEVFPCWPAGHQDYSQIYLMRQALPSSFNWQKQTRTNQQTNGKLLKLKILIFIAVSKLFVLLKFTLHSTN